MSNSSIILSSLDFDTHKNTLKAYLRSQDRFKDYDFEGSNMNVLLDILSYNTFHNAFYLNMIGNEMFLDTAQLRDSVVSHTKELNYVPKSFTSAKAVVNITVVSSNINKRSLVIPKGFTFTSPALNSNYTFTVAENITMTDYTISPDNIQITFTATDVVLYEGYYVTDTYTVSYQNPQRYLISNQTVDTSSIGVLVHEDAGATTYTYTNAPSLFDLTSTSTVFFIQAAENSAYEIEFGDGISGRAPKNNSVISIEYRITTGELPNGCNQFYPDGSIDGETNIQITCTSVAAGGSVSESLDSIKFNAPRHFTTQERAITTGDYETLLKLNFPEVNAVTAYGGETLNPPQYGMVFVAVDLVDMDGLPDIKKTEYYNFLKPRSPVSIQPVFVEPDYTYIGITSKIKYNVNVTSLSGNDIQSIVSSAILQYAQTYLNNFNKTFRYSKLVESIDASQVSIVSNETDFRIIKSITPITGNFETFDVNYNIELSIQYNAGKSFAVTSTSVIYSGQQCIIQDDGAGVLNLVSTYNNQIVTNVGTIDYTKGLLQFSNLKLDSYFGPSIKLYATSKDKDVSTINNVILNIIQEDISLTVEAVRI